MQQYCGIFADFNPHPREGGDLLDQATIIDPATISIHTPAKGVTTSGERFAPGW